MTIQNLFKFCITLSNSFNKFLFSSNYFFIFQYGKAQKEYLPVDGYEWMSEEELKNTDWSTIETDGERGCILEVDLHYPRRLHKLHADFPLAPLNSEIYEEDLSEETLTSLRLMQGKFDAKHTSRKLIATFRKRKKYVVHFQNLKTYLKLGMVLKKVRRGISFNQKPFMSDYIDYIAAMRSSSKSKWIQNTLKLYSNAIYGKMVENSRNYITVRFCQTMGNVQKAISSPLFKNYKIYGPGLVGIFMRPSKVEMKHCLPVGFSILEHSKRVMHELYYENILKLSGLKPPKEIRVCMSDTDSFILGIQCKNLNNFFKKISPCMDFSNFPKSHPLYSEENKGEVGFLKDEMKGEDNIAAVCSLRSKCYSIKRKKPNVVCNGCKKVCYVKKEEKICKKCNGAGCALCMCYNRCKGCPKSTTQLIDYEKYVDSLLAGKKQYETFQKITSSNHHVYTREQKRLVFSSMDDKRYYTCPIHSLPYGDYRIEKFQEDSWCPLC